MALPPDCWWSDDDARDVSHLRYHGVCKAIVVPGRVTIHVPGRDLVGYCGSRAQGKRHLERWLAANGVPLFDRAATRERMAAVEERERRHAAWWSDLMARQRPPAMCVPSPLAGRGSGPLPPVPSVARARYWQP